MDGAFQGRLAEREGRGPKHGPRATAGEKTSSPERDPGEGGKGKTFTVALAQCRVCRDRLLLFQEEQKKTSL